MALLALAARQVPKWRLSPPLQLLSSGWATAALCSSLVSEIIVDKRPSVPSRLSPGPFAGRLVFGGVAAGLLASGRRGEMLPAILTGAAGAAAGAFGGFAWRDELASRLHLSPGVAAVLEDMVALALGVIMVRPLIAGRLSNDLTFRRSD